MVVPLRAEIVALRYLIHSDTTLAYICNMGLVRIRQCIQSISELFLILLSLPWSLPLHRGMQKRCQKISRKNVEAGRPTDQRRRDFRVGRTQPRPVRHGMDPRTSQQARKQALISTDGAAKPGIVRVPDTACRRSQHHVSL